jgi:hypothetical protein
MDEDERVRLIDVTLIVAIVFRCTIGRYRESSDCPSSVTGSGTEKLEACAVDTEFERRFPRYVDRDILGTKQILFECLSARAKAAEVFEQMIVANSRLEEAIRRSAATLMEAKGVHQFQPDWYPRSQRRWSEDVRSSHGRPRVVPQV